MDEQKELFEKFRRDLIRAATPEEDKLEELLKRAENYKMTPEEKRLQRESWVRGEMAMGNDREELQIRLALTKPELENFKSKPVRFPMLRWLNIHTKPLILTVLALVLIGFFLGLIY